MRGSRITLAVVVLLCVSMLAFADTRVSYIGYSGYLLYEYPPAGSADWRPVVGTKEVVFEIYDAQTAGNKCWDERYDALEFKDGEFSVELGSLRPFGITTDLLGVTIATPVDFNSNTQYWLKVTIAGYTLQGRKRMLPVPYAFKAASVIDTFSGADPASPVNGQIWLRTDL